MRLMDVIALLSLFVYFCMNDARYSCMDTQLAFMNQCNDKFRILWLEGQVTK